MGTDVPYTKVMGFCLPPADGRPACTGGNAAGLVLPPHSARLSTADKIALAARLGFSETVFMTPCAVAQEGEPAADAQLEPALRLQFFTPTAEVDVCGHATIACMGYWYDNLRRVRASGVSLWDMQACAGSTGDGAAKKTGSSDIAISTKAGTLLVEFDLPPPSRDGGGTAAGGDECKTSDTGGPPRVFMTQNALAVDADQDVSAAAVAAALGIPPGALLPRPFAPCVASTGLRDIIVGVEPGWLAKLSPDMAAIAALSSKHDTIGMHVWAVPDDHSGAGDSEAPTCRARTGAPHVFEVRNFAPGCGIPEESATGTANCVTGSLLAPFLASCACDVCASGPGREKVEFTFLQGQFMDGNCQSVVNVVVEVEPLVPVTSGTTPQTASQLGSAWLRLCRGDKVDLPRVQYRHRGDPRVGGVGAVAVE